MEWISGLWIGKCEGSLLIIMTRTENRCHAINYFSTISDLSFPLAGSLLCWFLSFNKAKQSAESQHNHPQHHSILHKGYRLNLSPFFTLSTSSHPRAETKPCLHTSS